MSESAIGSERSRADESSGPIVEEVLDDVSDLAAVREVASSGGLSAVREFATSGGLSTFGGLLTLGQGVGALRRGKTGRGLLGVVAGGLFVAVGITRLRSSFRSGREVDRTDVVDGSPDLEDASDGLETGTAGGVGRGADPTDLTEAGSDFEDVDALGHEDDDRDRDRTDPAEITDTGPDIEDVDERSDAPGEGGDRRDDAETEVVDEDLDGGSTGEGDPEGTVTDEAEDRPAEDRHD